MTEDIEPPVLHDDQGRPVYVYGNLAARTGLEVSYLRTLNSQCKARLRDGDSRPGDLPPPDGYLTRQLIRGGGRRIGSRTPYWLAGGRVEDFIAAHGGIARGEAEGERACTP